MRLRHLLLLACTLLLNACASMPKDPIAPVARVDLDRFMGDWYVIASIPTFLEKGAHNAVESYHLDADGTIATTFTFRKGAFDGPEKKMTPRGFLKDTVSNARWGMQFIWPIKAEYLIAYVDPQYTRTIIARNARDYVWIMARTPTLPEADYQALVDQVGRLGYDVAALQKVPQRWSAN
jgi:apolipoprotein D and lipocalin family protein